MSVPKSKRGKSKVEFEMTYFKLADGIDNIVENYLWAEYETIQQHKLFIRLRAEAIEKLTDELVFHIKIANSIYPTCMAEWEERRVEMGKAIGTCYALLTHLQRVMMRLRIPDNKYTAASGTAEAQSPCAHRPDESQHQCRRTLLFNTLKYQDHERRQEL